MTVILQCVPVNTPAPRNALVLELWRGRAWRKNIGVQFARTPFRLLTYIACAPRATMNGAITFLYGERSDGGPDDAVNVIDAYLCRIRKAILHLRLMITSWPRESTWQMLDLDTGLPLREVRG
jgi:hypothetical protein